MKNEIIKNEYWGKSNFEDLVARGLISMYENKFSKGKKMLKPDRLTPNLVKRMKNLGCYFPPEDRVVIADGKEKIQYFDIQNDGLPSRAIYCEEVDDLQDGDYNNLRNNCYLEIKYVERLPKLPGMYKSHYKGIPFRLTTFWMRPNNINEGFSQYVLIDKEGYIYPTYTIQIRRHPITNIPQKIIYDSSCWEREGDAADKTTLSTAATIQLYQDRRFLWNVTANEGIAKATFGVYPEQIKSLFYSREIPLTETGRKRPILHWVNCHTRRLKNGHQIDIEKYLRGANEFVYHGTKFIITRPIKEMKK